jgi:hypothetical protein
MTRCSTTRSSKGEVRSSALWGKGANSIFATIVAVIALAAPATATARSYDAVFTPAAEIDLWSGFELETSDGYSIADVSWDE